MEVNMYELNSIRELKDYLLTGNELFSYEGINFTVEEFPGGKHIITFVDEYDLPIKVTVVDSLLSVYALFK